jgi:hypothetical protein
VGASTSLPPCSDARDTDLQVIFELVLGSAMKRLLVINDQHGTKVMREALLDEFNRIIRFQREQFNRVRATAAGVGTEGEPGSKP